MALDPVESAHSVNILGVEAGREAAVADALAKIIRNYAREQILERLGRPPWTITRRANAKIASRLVKLLEPLGAFLRVDPPLPSTDTTPVMPEPIVPARGGLMPQVQSGRDVAYPLPRPTALSVTLPSRTPEPMPEAAWSIQPLSLGGILDRSFQICKVHWWQLLAIAAIPWALINVPMKLVDAWTGGAAQAADPSAAGTGGAVLVMLLIYIPVYTFFQGALTYAVSRIYLGRTVEIKDALRFVYTKAGALILTSVEVLVIWFLFALAVIIPAAFLFLLVQAGGVSGWWTAVTWIPCAILYCYCFSKTLLYDKSIVLENKAYTDSINRSWNLLTGKAEGQWPRAYWVRMAVLSTLYFLIVIAIHLMADLPARLLSSVLSGPSQVVGESVRFALQEGGSLVLELFGSVWGVVFYYDVRCRKEGFDLEMLAGLVKER
ncbi:MAG: hypothetical protein AB1646_11435 [Thermodesulfobacteriota bacterium]